MGPYKVIDESETHITYEYRTGYTWTLYGALLVFVASTALPNEPLSMISLVVVVGYFIAKLALGRAIDSKIRKALRSSSVQITGSRMSFGNPLRIRIPK